MGTFFTPQKRKQPQNQIVETKVERCDHEGNGITYIPSTTKSSSKETSKAASKICFVAGAMPSERVKVRIVQQKSSVAHGQIVKVLEPSTYRKHPECQHALECGGCQLAHWQFSAQVDYKQEAVDSLLQKSTGLNALPWQAPITASESQYRRRARIATWWNNKTQRLEIGFRAEKSKKIVAVQRCEILTATFENFFVAVTPVINRLKKAKVISHIELIDAEPTPLVIFRHTQPLASEDAAALAAICQQNHWRGIAEDNEQQFVDLLSQTPYQETQFYSQALQVNEQSMVLKQYFRPSDFIQVNADINQQMVTQALQWLAPNHDDTILDLFCGIGNFSLPLAVMAKQVIAVEGVQSMVDHAQQNADANKCDNVRFYSADLNSDWKNAPWLGNSITKVLLDPARAGAQEAVIHIAKKKVKQVLYVSCHPVTFARDAKILCDSGYRIEKINLIHMFPNTAHVELMALFVL